MREVTAALAAVFGCALVGAAPQPPVFPRGLDTYLTSSVRLTPAERQSLLAGAPVTKILDADPSHEVAVFGAVWIKASPDDYVRVVTDIEAFERGEIVRVLSTDGLTMSGAARELGMSRATLYRKIAQYGIRTGRE